MPERETTPTRPGLWMWPGMMPILHSPGVMTPGQFGPIRRVFEPRERALAPAPCRATGMPSVMQTISGDARRRPLPGSRRPRTAAARRSRVALAPVFCDRLGDGVEDRQPRCVVPPLPGVTPPTTWCRTRCACLAWKVPCAPVKPWHDELACSCRRGSPCHAASLQRARRPSRAASSMSSAAVIVQARLRAASCLPCSTLVPSRRTTSGTCSADLLAPRRSRPRR